MLLLSDNLNSAAPPNSSSSFTSLFSINIHIYFSFLPEYKKKKKMKLKPMEKASDSPTKPAKKRTRKRPYTRKASLTTTFINMAEARREIVNALHLHRSSTVRNAAVPCSSQQLTDSIPQPEPTWSTTAPAVLCAPVPAVEILEVEWFDNVSASCSWWMGFLSSLDRKIRGHEPAEESGGSVTGSDEGKTGSGRDEHNPFFDEWVVFPPGEE